MASPRCPCGSGRTYAECCAPLHEGAREAETAEALMRSRYSAFATKNVDYLIKTLHPDHEDRRAPRDALVAALREACRRNKYTGLEIREASGPDAEGIARVTFFAKVFEKGKDRSFSERSLFARAEGGWRYLAGEEIGPSDAHPAPGRP